MKSDVRIWPISAATSRRSEKSFAESDHAYERVPRDIAAGAQASGGTFAAIGATRAGGELMPHVFLLIPDEAFDALWAQAPSLIDASESEYVIEVHDFTGFRATTSTVDIPTYEEFANGRVFGRREAYFVVARKIDDQA